ncbi:MAG TPA: hypothetical protein VN428_03895 [Bryobacteraceae bacterium]|nr:hypothetical protein [Bryobacteraceae bacterium]
MNLALAVVALAILIVAAGFAYVITKLARRKPEPAPDLDWCRQFTTARYRPMERLLRSEDFDFLAAQPGFDPGIGRELEKTRRRIFKRYLRSLGRDFDRLMSAAALVMTQSQEDRPELARILLQHRVGFAWAMAGVRCRLVLNGMGIGTVDVKPLVDAIESARARFTLDAPQPIRMAAL